MTAGPRRKYLPIASPPLPAGRYAVIYADPPWSYRDQARAGARGAVFHYPTLTREALAALPVADLALPDAALFLWATAPLLPEAIALIDRWGFAYKTLAFTWVKRCRKADGLHWGMGSSTRANPEYVLLGVRGRLPRRDAGVHSVVMAPVGQHSAKPDEVRRRIERLFGEVPRIELFARQHPSGWDVWGADAGNGLGGAS
jgi:N6-adenosine-specific RNA methylase IME4